MNIVDGKIYVGSSINLKNRWRSHINKLGKGTHDNAYLQSAVNKHGLSSFHFGILEFVEDFDSLTKREQFFIDTLKVLDRSIGYNLSPIAGSQLNFKHTNESKEKMSIARSGENSNMAKLDWTQVLKIRSEYSTKIYTKKELAEKYSVSSSTIGRIVSGKSWTDESYLIDNFIKLPVKDQIKEITEGRYSGAKNAFAKFSQIEIAWILAFHMKGFTKAEISRIVNATDVCVGNIINGKTYKAEYKVSMEALALHA